MGGFLPDSLFTHPKGRDSCVRKDNLRCHMQVGVIFLKELPPNFVAFPVVFLENHQERGALPERKQSREASWIPRCPSGLLGLLHGTNEGPRHHLGNAAGSSDEPGPRNGGFPFGFVLTTKKAYPKKEKQHKMQIGPCKNGGIPCGFCVNHQNGEPSKRKTHPLAQRFFSGSCRDIGGVLKRSCGCGSKPMVPFWGR